MEEIRSSKGKLICKIDMVFKKVEIVRQKEKIEIKFDKDGSIIIERGNK